MITPKFKGTIIKGQIRADVGFYKWLTTLEGQAVEVIVRKQRKQRSDNQNRFYWGVIIEMLSEFTGYTREEMHEALKFRFLAAGQDENGLVKIRSTATLTTDEFINYTNNIVIWAAQELGVFVPDPGSAEF